MFTLPESQVLCFQVSTKALGNKETCVCLYSEIFSWGKAWQLYMVLGGDN